MNKYSSKNRARDTARTCRICVATGRTIEETRQRMAKALEMHLAAMREDGDEIPEPSHFEVVETA